MLTQLKSPNTGHLIFIALDIDCNTQEGKPNRCFLQQRHYKLEVSACLYNRYSVRYKFSKHFKGFLSRLHHALIASTDEIFPPPYLMRGTPHGNAKLAYSEIILILNPISFFL